jgi:hypothetical protein
MTGDALQGRNAIARRPTYYVEKMTMAVVTLLRVIPGGVAVDTARMSQYGINLLPSGHAFGAGYARCGR